MLEHNTVDLAPLDYWPGSQWPGILLFPHSQLGRPKPLALSDSGLGVRVSIPIALPPPGMRNEAPLPT